MITKNQLKYYSSLLQKKNRIKEKKFLVEGLKNIEEGLNSSYECEVIFATNKFIEENEDFLKCSLLCDCPEPVPIALQYQN